MGVFLYLGGCGAFGALVAWLHARGLPFATANAGAAITADEG